MRLKKNAIIVDANSSDEFLKYMDKIGLTIGDNIQILEVEEFDKSLTVTHKKSSITLSNEAAGNILVAV